MAEEEKRRLLREARIATLRYARTRRLDDLRDAELRWFLYYEAATINVQEELGAIWEEIRDKRRGEVSRERLVELRGRAWRAAARFRRYRDGVRRIWGRGSRYIWLRHPEWVRLRIGSRAYALLTRKFPELETLYHSILSKIRELWIPPPPVGLCRVKIRIYNIEISPESPEGMFQGWFDIDAWIDPETREVDWEWWWTKRLIANCKRHFVMYWKGMPIIPRPQRDIWATLTEEEQAKIIEERTLLAYMEEVKGIPHREARVKYKKPEVYAKTIPREFVRRAQELTVEELIVGESAVVPRPIRRPEGKYFQKVMIIDWDGVIRYHERIDRWIYRPTEEEVRRVMEDVERRRRR